MKRLGVLCLLLAVAVAPSDAAAKDVATLVVVGADGRSARIEPEPAVLAVMLHHPASVYAERPRPAEPRGGYVRLYPLGAGGFPAIPGRFYPATGALCFGWNQAVARSCGRLGRPPRLSLAARGMELFGANATVLRDLRPGTPNLVAAVALALDRRGASFPARRPRRCLSFVARWEGPRTAGRPGRLCVSRTGVYADGRLHPTGPATWWLARASFSPRPATPR